MAKKDKAEAVAAENGEAAVAAPAAAEKPARIQQNGVTRPADGTATGRVWAISDELSKAAGEAIGRGKVMEQGKAEGLNEATIATQYGRWRKFHNLKAVPRPPAAPKAKKGEADGSPVETATIEE